MKCIIPLLTIYFSITYSIAQNPKALDYSLQANWASLPWMQDYSDHIPGTDSIQNDSFPLDVFFIHPTSYTGNKINFADNAPIDDSKINNKTDEKSIKYQASLFNKVGNVYAPRYRQAHISTYFIADKKHAENTLNFAYQDVKNAFLYYLEHYNNGKPFILASHSQGTNHAVRLIREVVQNSSIEDRMVVAYLVGMPVSKDDITIKPCTTPIEYHCFCSWRTFLEGYIPSYVSLENEVVVTNPITWYPDSTFSQRKDHKGAVLLNFEKGIQSNIVTTKRHKNVLWIKKPYIRGRMFLGMKNYHVGDYNLFYKDVQENALARFQHYLDR